MNDDKAHFISGAGPAGLVAALTIAKAGGRAVVYERQTDVGARFHGDFQGLENWTTSGDVLEELSAMGIKPGFEAAPFQEGNLYDADGREFRFRSPDPLFYLVRRGTEANTLDQSLKAQAIASGVEIRFGEAAHHLPEGGIVAEGPRAADVIAVGYTFETDMADGAFAAFSDSLAPKGYSYALIWNGHGTVASCMFDDFHKEKNYLGATVDFFRRKVGLKMNQPRRFGGMGGYGCPRTARNENILLAGEAAGFQDALWGFGMRYAMVSGHLAARALIENQTASYDQHWRRRIGGFLRSSMVNRYLFERLGNGGYAALIQRMSLTHNVREWLRSHYAPRLWKRLLFPLAHRAIRTKHRDTICVMEGCDCTWCHCHHNDPHH